MLRSSWRIIWCCETCHKDEQEAARTKMKESASTLRGDFSCFKKAQTYQSWLFRAWEPHVLVADGREIKRCVDALIDAPRRKRPLLIAVLQGNPVHAARTRDWAASLPAVDMEVHLVESIQAFGTLFQEKGERFRSREPPALCGWGVSTAEPPPDQASRRMAVGDATRVHMLSHSGVAGFEAPMPLLTVLSVQVIQPPIAMLDIEAVTKMLIEAEPELYEE